MKRRLKLLLSILSAVGICIWGYYFLIPEKIHGLLMYTSGTQIWNTCGTNSKTFKVRYQCIENLFQKISRAIGMQQTVFLLHTMQQSFPELQNCHTLGHALGRSAYVYEKKSLQELFTNSTTTELCGSGIMHGYILAVFKETGVHRIKKSVVKELCMSLNTTYKKMSCHHFIGHFSVLQTSDDLEKSLEICDLVSDMFKEGCYGGVYMEHFEKLMLTEHGIVPEVVFDAKHAQYALQICSDSSDLRRLACYSQAASTFMHVLKTDINGIYAYCDSAVVPSVINECKMQAAGLLAVNNTKIDAIRLSAACTYFGKDDVLAPYCINTVLGMMAGYTTTFEKRAIVFCENSLPRYKSYCSKRIDDHFHNAPR